MSSATTPAANAAAPADRQLPLVVDLDGTLTPSDTLVEGLLQLVKNTPLQFFKAAPLATRDRAGLKARVAKNTTFSAELLPYNQPLLSYLREQKANGRRLVLASAADQSVANSVAAHLGLFDDVLSSSNGNNLKGEKKLAALQALLPQGFVYAGDSHVDLPVWQGANGTVLVNTSAKVAAEARATTRIECEFPRQRLSLKDWAKAMRLHQWLKNLLLFVPLVTAYSFFDIEKIVAICVAFLAFSLAASANYIVNDILDLDSDRAHHSKHSRAFASGRVPIARGIIASGGLLVAALLLAAWVSLPFLLILLTYLLLTNLYSLSLKAYVLIDVVVLSLLYTIRILAGSAAIGVHTSTWLLSFSVFVFLSLALVKRCSELVVLRDQGKAHAHGRDYRVTDLVVLWPMGLASALSAVVMFGLFISAPETQANYATPDLLWIVSVVLIYWLSRLWIKTSRGEMHDDPVVYAVTNRGSRYTVMIMIAAMLLARFFAIDISL